MERFSLESAWETALEEIDLSEHGPAQAAFLKMIKPIADIENTILLAVPNDFTKMFVETHLLNQLKAALSTTMGRETQIALTVDPNLNEELFLPQNEGTKKPWDSKDIAQILSSPLPTESQKLTFPNPDDDVPIPERSIPFLTPQNTTMPVEETELFGVMRADSTKSGLQQLPGRLGATKTPETPPSAATLRKAAKQREKLNPKYTFDTFVIGPSNRFAHAAALAVSEAPAQTYNPLFIYGDSGLGKTHLLHAMGHYSLSLYPHLSVTYVNSEEFTNAFINAIMQGNKEEFKKRYRETDILMIDDIQFIQNKKETVEEFFHTFNALSDAGKQIVITSDLPPKALSQFEERLRSRFQSGLTTDVQPPDLETRVAILQMKATSEGIKIDHEILTYIATRISANIRELEGALLRVTAFAHLTHQTINLALAKMVLKDVLSDPDETTISVPQIMGQTAAYFNVTIDQLTSSDRNRHIVQARQIAMYLCRNLTDLSLPKIGEAFGGRDHTTVMYANKKITNQMTQKPETYNNVTELTSQIKNMAKKK